MIEMESEIGKMPPKERSEWRGLVTANLQYQFQNYVLQMKMTEYHRKIADGQLTVEQAIDELYLLCTKYHKAVQSDILEIFKDW